MGIQRGFDGADPFREDPVAGLSRRQELDRAARAGRLGTGTLACPRCDAPVVLSAPRSTLAVAMTCPFCDHAGTLRDFLTLTDHPRPTRVVVRVIQPARTGRQRPAG